MINFDDVTVENIKEYNSNWLPIPNHPSRILITIGGSGSSKTTALLDLISHNPDIEKMYLYAKDPYEPKYQLFICKHKSVELKHGNDSKTFI